LPSMTKERAHLAAGSFRHGGHGRAVSPPPRSSLGQSSTRNLESLVLEGGAAKHDCMPKAHDHKAMYQRNGMANSFQ
jgi:hypothetical protein